MTPEERKIRELRKHLRDLTQTVMRYLSLMDEAMKMPSTEDRGKRIAQLNNQLELQNDIAKRYGLEIGLKKPRR